MTEPSVPSSLRMGEALTWAARAQRGDLLAFMILSAIPVVLTAAQGIGTTPVQNVLVDCLAPQTEGQRNACAAALSPTALLPVLISVVLVLAAFIAQVGVVRGAIVRTRGQSPTFAEMLETQNLRSFIVYVLLFRLMFFLGIALCVLPGLVVLVFFQFGPYLILDRGMGVRQAFRASAAMAGGNLPVVVLLALIVAVLELLGGLLFGLPMLVTLPFSALITAYVYRRLSGQAVA